MLVIKISTFLVVLGMVICYPMSCPTPEHLDPCRCKRFAYGLHITCENITKADVLIHSFKVLEHYRIENVVLHGLNITESLPDDLFKGIEISRLRVEKSVLQFEKPAFIGLNETLHILNVAQQSMIKSKDDFSIAPLSIAPLSKLSELSIKANTVKVVKDDWLNENVPNVQKLILDQDGIEEVQYRAFAELLELERISMANNEIVTVKRSMFPRPATKLTSIDLSWNKIRTLPYDFFYEMPALKEILLSANEIITLEKETWKNVLEELDTVLLARNKIECNDQLNWLKSVKKWPNHFEANCVDSDKSLRQVYT